MTETPIPLHILQPDDFEAWRDAAVARDVSWAGANGFTGALGQRLILADDTGQINGVLIGWGTGSARMRGRFHLAAHSSALPDGNYAIGLHPEDFDHDTEILGWGLAAYRFDRYRTQSAPTATLVDLENAPRLSAIVDGALLTQSLIDTPAADMGPSQLEAAVTQLAADHGAEITTVVGDALLTENYPMIHAVGRASDDAPRLIDLRWGAEDAAKVTLVGKGVCFDTGGLNLKPAGSMGLMKKDMGGAANAIGLAKMIMALNLPVRLRLLIPAVENSVSGNAFRPQDILTSRKGLSVEINNTDAEGRLVLADALALADEEAPDLLLCLATLTGAARVALGPDLPPFFTDDEELATQLGHASAQSADPLWRMPFWDPYEAMIEPGIADLDNAPKGGFAGAITAALFLRRFVEDAGSFAHFDLYGWTPSAKPARPKGGAHQGIRAMLAVIEERYS
ncbi:leucyl aminopeptidase family protein [Pontivivens insulae]|uniref:Putative cytosol aminopeptidase n=1 Tax=Pontivivens insulae TaxID=1639689 RepID=A0A2R8AFF6_9RHOB|nr:leucyl aminopeptidase family protein [Pontivivens insulae]RED12216.1 leucyl aminopeptidase [Pontivivens insulae]SPF30972.1 putative cytosol aminopeptidase [Pontivivens insulae]